MKSLKDKLLVFIPGLALLTFSYGGYWSSHWYAKWSLIVAMFSVFYSVWFSMRTSFYLFPVLLVSLLSASYIGVWNDNQYLHTSDSLMNTTLGKGALYSLLTVVMASFLVATLTKNFIKPVELFLASICVLSSIYTVLQFGRIAYERGAFSGNASMNASLIACTLPFALEIHRKLVVPVVALSGLACILTHSSIGIGCFFVVLSCYGLRSLGASFKSMFALGLVGGILLLAALKFIPAEWASSSGRLGVWKSVFSWWINHTSWLVGAGLGTGISLFPSIQRMYHTEATGYMLWLHSSWLQILFQIGILGFIFAVIAYGFLAFRSWNKPHIFASLIGFGTCAIADYPLELPIHCAAITLLVWLVLKNKGNDSCVTC